MKRAAGFVIGLAIALMPICGWGQTPDPDLNNDGTVTLADISRVSSCYGQSPPVAPVITLSGPPDGQLLNQSQVALAGTLNEEGLTVDVNGVSATVTGTDFAADVSLAEGENVLVVTATTPSHDCIVADTNGDGIVDIADLQFVSQAFGQTGFPVGDPIPDVRTASLSVTVIVDRTPPVVTPPSDLTLTAPDSSGLPPTNAAIAAFLAGASAQDDRDGPLPTSNDAPTQFPIGVTVVTFTAADQAGNSGTATASVTLLAPSPAPTITLNAPANVTLGQLLSLQAVVSPNVVEVEFYLDGASVGLVDKPPFTLDVALPPDATGGSLLNVQARGRAADGQEATSQAQVLVLAPSVTVGIITGRVLDDTSGLPLEGATVTLESLDGSAVDPPLAPVETDERGRYRISSDSGLASLSIEASGHTSAFRQVDVVTGHTTTPIDGRLTPLGPGTAISSILGGRVESAKSSIEFPPSALPGDAQITLVDISSQGLMAPPPAGWTPIAAAAVGPGGLPLSDTATLDLSKGEGLPDATTFTAAHWDPAAQQWMALDSATWDAGKNVFEVGIEVTGEFAVLVPDPAPNAPSPPMPGEPLPGVVANPPPDDTTGDISPAPRVLFVQPGARSIVTTSAHSQSEPLPSGTIARLHLQESIEFLDDSHLYPEPDDEVLILFRGSDGGTGVSSVGPVSPSRDYSGRLKQGVIDLALSLPTKLGEPEGTVIDTAGGSAGTPDEGLLSIPAGAAAEAVPVRLSAIANDDFPYALPAGLSFLAGIDVDFHGAELSGPGTLSLPAPASATAGKDILVVRLAEALGTSHLALEAFGKLQAGRLISTTDPLGNGAVMLPGVHSEGRYAFLSSDAALGFITGTLSDNQGLPLQRGLVGTDTFAVEALTDATGKYTLAAPLGQSSVTATNLLTGDITSLTAQVDAPDQPTTLNAGLAATPPTVVSVSPANAATDVPLAVTVNVVFSEPIDAASIGSNALRLSQNGTSIAGRIASGANASTLVFRPDALLTSQTTYQITVSEALLDLSGNPLGTDVVSEFTTVDQIAPEAPPPGSITATIPAPDQTTVTGGPGTGEPTGLVIIKNRKTGSTVSVVPEADGSFVATVPAVVTDKFDVIIRDASGNETVVPLPRFTDPDGHTVVGSEGGMVEGFGGVFVDIPKDALPDGTIVKVDPQQVTDLPIPAPDEYPFIGGIKLDLGGATPSHALDVGITAPADAGETEQIIVAHVVSTFAGKGWAVDDRAVLDKNSGKYVTASPPFPGVLVSGLFSFLRPVAPCTSFTTTLVVFPFQVLASVPPFVFVIDHASEPYTVVAPSRCGDSLHVQVHNLSTGQFIDDITSNAPSLPGLIERIGIVSGDTTSPTVTIDTLPTDGGVAPVKLTFSEPMDADSVRDNFHLRDSHAVEVEGEKFPKKNPSLNGNEFLREFLFQPTTPLRLGEEYTLSLREPDCKDSQEGSVGGAKDASWNCVSFEDYKFKTFAPAAISTIEDDLEKNGPGNVHAAVIGSTLFVANGIANRATTSYSASGEPRRLLVLDIADARKPKVIGWHKTFTNPRFLNAVEGVDLQACGPAPCDLLLVAGGGQDEMGRYLSAKLELYDVSACTHHMNGVSNCLDPSLSPLKGWKLLSWIPPPASAPPTGVPVTWGIPSQPATLHARNSSGKTTALLAYVPVAGVGLVAVDVTSAFNLQPGDAQPPRDTLAPAKVVPGDGNIFSVAVLKGLVMALSFNGAVDIYDSNLDLIRSISNGNGFRIAPFENFVADVDMDGHLGLAEDGDNDGTRATDELFDLMLLTSGSVTTSCPSLRPCGYIDAFDLSADTDLKHTVPVDRFDRIYLPAPALNIDVDLQAKRAYVGSTNGRVFVVDLVSFEQELGTGRRELSAQDVNRDGLDDHVLLELTTKEKENPSPLVVPSTGRVLATGPTSGIEIFSSSSLDILNVTPDTIAATLNETQFPPRLKRTCRLPISNSPLPPGPANEGNYYSIPLTGSTNRLQRFFTLELTRQAELNSVEVQLLDALDDSVIAVVSHVVSGDFEISDTGQATDALVHRIGTKQLKVRVTMGPSNPSTVPPFGAVPPADEIKYRFSLDVTLAGIHYELHRDSNTRRALWNFRYPGTTRRFGRTDEVGGDSWVTKRVYEWLSQPSNLLDFVVAAGDASGEHGTNLGHCAHSTGIDLDVFPFSFIDPKFELQSHLHLGDHLESIRKTMEAAALQPNDGDAAKRLAEWFTAQRDALTALSKQDQIVQETLCGKGKEIDSDDVLIQEGWMETLLKTGQLEIPRAPLFKDGLPDLENGKQKIGKRLIDLGIHTWQLPTCACTMINNVHNNHFHIRFRDNETTTGCKAVRTTKIESN